MEPWQGHRDPSRTSGAQAEFVFGPKMRDGQVVPGHCSAVVGSCLSRHIQSLNKQESEPNLIGSENRGSSKINRGSSKM